MFYEVDTEHLTVLMGTAFVVSLVKDGDLVEIPDGDAVRRERFSEATWQALVDHDVIGEEYET